MPAPLLPSLETFTAQIDPRPMWLSGTPSSVMDGAQKYLTFADQADDAARLLRSLDTADFQGSEAEKFRSKLDSHLPEWLTKVATAHRNVGLGIKAFGAAFTTQHTLMTSIRAQAPGSHQAVQTAAHNVNRLEGELTAAEGVEATASGNLAQAKVAVTAAAATPGLPAAVANETQADSAFTAAEAHTNAVRAELAAAWTHFHAMMAVWNGLLTQANGVHEAMESASIAAKSIVDKEHDTPFEKNPSGWDAFWKGVGDWIDSHADILGKISELLTFVGSILMMFPGLGTIIGGALVGIGLAISAALVLTGNRSWGQFAMDAVGAIPGGRGIKLGKEAAELAAKKVGKEGVENAEKTAARESSLCSRAGHPVDIATGAMVDDWTDLTIGGRLPLVIRREYSSNYGAGRVFGEQWSSLMDVRIEVADDAVTFVGDAGQVVNYPLPSGDGEVMPVYGRMPLSFVDGAYRVRDVEAGFTYEFSLFTEDSALHVGASASVLGPCESSLAGVSGTAISVGLSAVVHHSGHRIDMIYDPHTGMPAEIVHSGGARVIITADSRLGRVTALAVADVDGLVTVASYEYDQDGRLVAVRNSTGKPYRYEYDQSGRIAALIDREGAGYHYRYDSVGRVTASVGTHGMMANAFVYLDDTGADAPVGGSAAVMVETAVRLNPSEGNTRISERLDRLLDLPIVRALRAGGAAAAHLTGGGRTETPDRNAAIPWTSRVRDSDAEFLNDEVLGEIRPWVYRFTPAGDVWRVVSPEGAVTDYVRDDAHLLTSWTRADGSRVQYVRDEFGCVTTTVLPDGGEVSTVFGGFGVPARQVDQLGRVTEVSVDEVGNVVAVADPMGATTRYSYELRPSGSVMTGVVDPSGLSTSLDCDDAGRVVRRIEPGGRVWSYERNVFGDVTAVMDPDGLMTRQRWSPEGWLLSQKFADGASRETVYDAEGHPVRSVDEAGYETRTEYVAFDHVAARIDSEGGRLTCAYNTVFDQVLVTSPDGLDWTLGYDRDSRVIAETDYNGARTVYELDTRGRAVVTTDALDRTVRREFDVMGRLTGEFATNDGATTFAYDQAGELVEAANGDAIVRFERDQVGRVTRETVNGVQVESKFDVAGRRIRRIVMPSESVGAFGTDFSFDRMSGDLHSLSVSTPGGVIEAPFIFGYDAVGRETSRTVGRSILVSRWDARSRLAAQQVVGDVAGGGDRAVGSVIAGREWAYRADGYVTAVDDRLRGARSFQLDRLGRVTRVSVGRGSDARHNAPIVGAAGSVGTAESYSYSPAGVLMASSSSGDVAGVASSPTAGAARVDRSERVGAVGTLVTRVGRSRFEYDAAGQMVRRHTRRLSRKPAVTRFTYTDRGQIRSANVADGSSWTYGYDAFGRRVSKTHISSSGSVVDRVVFGWDGADVVCQTNTALTARAGVGAGGSSTWVWTYHPGSGEPVAQYAIHHTPGTDFGGPGGDASRDAMGASGRWSQARVDAEFYAIVADLNGAPTELLDPDLGTVAGRSTTTLWGQTRWSGASTVLRFAGQQCDSETGLHYNRFRYYDPATSTYTSPDPLGLAPNPGSATAYVHNPHTWVDPLGLEGCVTNGHGDTPGSQVAKVNGRSPINSKFAGKDFPLSDELAAKYPEGVKFNDKGFPDFGKYAKHEVNVPATTNRPADFAAANRAAGIDRTPSGMTWHHVEDGKTMQLVPYDLHQGVRHTGGVAIARQNGL